ncbi:GntR family transcriptional regulator [Georgenia satyanarayanai]|uniref:FadR/GntR family transcriptional regulator n=1 Tax=Georgenia satyanarayanai TaxID=860221 RepID=UPI00203AA040|nr:GntR family transcriptional regulator [Georgenia satyanarayanai]MCM3660955.1 GntR family transcriptional regulator [Georgenia satyanarayanai]
MAIPSRAQAAGTGRRRPSTADKIKDYILMNGLQPGDSLPTEAELCELLEVSRSNLREAVRTLTTLNIVSVRHGHGTFVGDMSLDALVESLVFRGVLIPGDDLQALRDIVEVRQALDTAMAHKVAATLRGTHNPDLHDLVEQMVEIASRGEVFPAQDRAFHTSLLARIDNTLVGQLVGAFWDVHTAVMPRLGISLPADLVQTARAHGEMLEAAEDGDADALIASVGSHYEPIMRALDGARRDPDVESVAPAAGMRR